MALVLVDRPRGAAGAPAARAWRAGRRRGGGRAGRAGCGAVRGVAPLSSAAPPPAQQSAPLPEPPVTAPTPPLRRAPAPPASRPPLPKGRAEVGGGGGGGGAGRRGALGRRERPPGAPQRALTGSTPPPPAPCTPRGLPWRGQALEKYNIEKDIAAYIKKEFDKKYNPTWHAIVGRNFGSYVTHETKHFIYFYLGQVAVLLFKSG